MNDPTTHPQAAPTRAPARWYVRVDDTDYGPFDDATLLGYLREGRVTAQSLVRHGPQGAYRQLSTVPALAVHTQALQAAPEVRACLVMGEIRSGRSMLFLQALQTLGDVQRVGDALWLVRAPGGPKAVMAALSAPLGAEDRVFVVDAEGAAHAGFNLGSSVDSRLAPLLGR